MMPLETFMPKGRMSPQWRGMLRRFFRHTITVVRPSTNDEFGNPTAGERIEHVPCLIDGSKTRVLNRESKELQAEHAVEFSSEMGIETETQLLNGRALNGQILLADGKVFRIDNITHPSHGGLVTTALVHRN